MVLEFPRIQEQGQHLPKSFQRTQARGSPRVALFLELMANCSSVSSVEEHRKHHL